MLLNNLESMPIKVFNYIYDRTDRYMKQYSQTADSTNYVTTCVCGANFGDFHLFTDPDGAKFPTTDSAAAMIVVEAMPFTGSYIFEGSYGQSPDSIIFVAQQFRNANLQLMVSYIFGTALNGQASVRN